jgi:hypothetical protein
LRPARSASVVLIFERQALSDFVEALFEFVEPGVHRAIMQVENVTKRAKSENPMMAFDIAKHRLDRLTYKCDRVQQAFHRVLPNES